MTNLIQENVANEQEARFTVQNIYIKDLSFEAPKAPFIFQEEWQPKLNFDLQLGSEAIGDNLYEVTLNLTLTVNLPGEGEQEQIAFLLEAMQAGIFLIAGIEGAELEQILATTCPTILFPYVRELASNLMIRGGFPQLFLPPINFDAMYLQHLQQKEAASH